MKLPGRTPILVELAASEYNALKRVSDRDKVSMTVIVRDLVREHLMRDELLGSLSKRVIYSEEESKEPLMIHFADEEHKFLMGHADRTGKTVTTVIRNLIRTKIMGIGKLVAE